MLSIKNQYTNYFCSKRNIKEESSDLPLFYEDSKALKNNSGYSVPQVKLTKAATR